MNELMTRLAGAISIINQYEETARTRKKKKDYSACKQLKTIGLSKSTTYFRINLYKLIKK